MEYGVWSQEEAVWSKEKVDMRSGERGQLT